MHLRNERVVVVVAERAIGDLRRARRRERQRWRRSARSAYDFSLPELEQFFVII